METISNLGSVFAVMDKLFSIGSSFCLPIILLENEWKQKINVMHSYIQSNRENDDNSFFSWAFHNNQIICIIRI